MTKQDEKIIKKILFLMFKHGKFWKLFYHPRKELNKYMDKWEKFIE